MRTSAVIFCSCAAIYITYKENTKSREMESDWLSKGAWISSPGLFSASLSSVSCFWKSPFSDARNLTVYSQDELVQENHSSNKNASYIQFSVWAGIASTRPWHVTQSHWFVRILVCALQIGHLCYYCQGVFTLNISLCLLSQPEL